MRLESLDLDHHEESRAELELLADQLREQGWDVEVATSSEVHWSRIRESAEHALVDVLNMVLDEAERHAIDAAIDVLLAWALHRRYFRGWQQADPDAAVWTDGEIVRTVLLPSPDEGGADEGKSD